MFSTHLQAELVKMFGEEKVDWVSERQVNLTLEKDYWEDYKFDGVDTLAVNMLIGKGNRIWNYKVSHDGKTVTFFKKKRAY